MWIMRADRIIERNSSKKETILRLPIYLKDMKSTTRVQGTWLIPSATDVNGNPQVPFEETTYEFQPIIDNVTEIDAGFIINLPVMEWNNEKKVFVMREEDRMQAVEYMKELKTKFRDELIKTGTKKGAAPTEPTQNKKRKVQTSSSVQRKRKSTTVDSDTSVSLPTSVTEVVSPVIVREFTIDSLVIALIPGEDYYFYGVIKNVNIAEDDGFVSILSYTVLFFDGEEIDIPVMKQFVKHQ